MGNKVTTLDKVAINDLIDLGLRMPDGSTELFEVVNKNDGFVALMTKNIIDFMPFNSEDSKQSGKANSYKKSSVRLYLARLYQTVAEGNKLLETYTVGNKEFFLPTRIALGSAGPYRWQAFKDDRSRIKYPGTFAAAKDFIHDSREADWYWTSSPSTNSARSVHLIDCDGALHNDFVHYKNVGVAPAVVLKASAPVILINGVWRLYENHSQEGVSTPPKNNGNTTGEYEIKVGDWVEVLSATPSERSMGIIVGDIHDVVAVERNGRVWFTNKDGKLVKTWVNNVGKVVAPIEPPKLKDVPKAIESAVSKFEILARSYTESLSETLVAKNADYGNSFAKSYEKHGLVSTVIRLEDKLNRLESLIENEAKVNESIDDTLLDIAGYAILTLIAREGK